MNLCKQPWHPGDRFILTNLSPVEVETLADFDWKESVKATKEQSPQQQSDTLSRKLKNYLKIEDKSLIVIVLDMQPNK